MFQQREGRWVLVDLIGKRNKVPMPNWTKKAIDEYASVAGFSEGNVFRPINKSGRINRESLTEQAIYNVVSERAQALGLVRLHRTTCAGHLPNWPTKAARG